MKKNPACSVKPILLAPALFFWAVAVFAAPQEAAQKPPAKAQGRNMAEYELFFEAVDAIKGRYVTEPEQKKLIRDAIAGMAMGLDPFSRYVASKDAEDEESYIEGSYIGIGVEVAMREEGLEVVTPIEGGSAKLAGIASGDLIEEINGDQVAEMGYDEAIERLKGPEDTKVTLGVRRGQSQELKIVTLTRRRVEMKSVYLQEAQGAFIIRLTSFQRSTAEELRSMLAKISASKPKSGVIIDLRDNPGGLIDQAVKAADLFLKKGKIVY
ncbi:PDZ domain-containing protein, partial [bacterium]